MSKPLLAGAALALVALVASPASAAACYKASERTVGLYKFCGYSCVVGSQVRKLSWQAACPVTVDDARPQTLLDRRTAPAPTASSPAPTAASQPHAPAASASAPR